MIINHTSNPNMFALVTNREGNHVLMKKALQTARCNPAS